MSRPAVVIHESKSDLARVCEVFGLAGELRSLSEVSAQVAEMKIDQALEAVRACGATNAILYKLIAPRRTIDHRRQKHQRLTREESDRAVIFANTVALAERIFGERDKAARWLGTQNGNLGAAKPLDLLRTALGAREVEEELIRIEEGYFA
jgi:putative toxin-antitoxin system antitoxin component (TIGR02293 family)